MEQTCDCAKLSEVWKNCSRWLRLFRSEKFLISNLAKKSSRRFFVEILSSEHSNFLIRRSNLSWQYSVSEQWSKCTVFIAVSTGTKSTTVAQEIPLIVKNKVAACKKHHKEVLYKQVGVGRVLYQPLVANRRLYYKVCTWYKGVPLHIPGQDLNLRPTNRKSIALSTALQCHPQWFRVVYSEV